MQEDWTEREYRKDKRDSFSSIKAFIEDRQKYNKKYILGLGVIEDDENTNENLRIGSLVDCLLFTPQEVENKFVTTSSEIPKKQMMDFIQNLYKRTIISTDKDGVVNRSLVDLIEDAYNDTKFDKGGEIVAFKAKTLDKLKEDFIVKKIGYDYYLDLRNRGDKFVITDNELSNALKLVGILKNHSYTRDILASLGINQMIITGSYRGLEVKCMIDKVIINEEKKEIYAYDLKTTWNVDQFDYNYLKYRYYLQLALYTEMLRKLYPDYDVKPMQFIVTDKIGYMDPIVYITDERHLEQGLEGFPGYIGLNTAIDDLLYIKNKGIWSSTAEVQRHNGKKQVKLY